jgi:hypothetical protein
METTTGTVHYCKACGLAGAGKFCSSCGQSYSIKRITLKGLLHDVFHFFTHLEKGFGYTLKRLVTAPGTMEREYVEGNRSRYQKPFSLFFICASVNAIMRYWIEELLLKYFNEGSAAEASLRHEFQLLLLLLVMPVVTFLMWLLFKKSKYNYAETGVQQLYIVSVMLLASTLIAFMKFIAPGMDVAYIEFPLFAGYSIITHIRFYHTSNSWVVAIKSLIVTALFFLAIQYMEDLVISLINAKK